ncbi:MAG: hypothetical protein AAFV53_10540 [Myxococcota bacterium]
MFVSSIVVQGHTDLPDFQLDDLDRVVHLKGPTPETTALGDALELVFAALSPAHMVALLARWEVLAPDEDAEIIADPFPSQAQWLVPAAAADLVADAGQRAITVSVTFTLDPLLFRDLRAQAARHPQLVSALAEGPNITITVGGLFARSFDALAVALQSVTVGNERFPTLPRERPAWLTRLLLQMGERFHRYTGPTDGLAAVALQMATSREHFERYQAWQAALERNLGAARVARGPGDVPIVIIDERPLRRWGPRGVQMVAQAGAVYLSGADILWADAQDDTLRQGLDAGALEQVFLIGDAGEIEVRATRAPAPRAAVFPAGGRS